MKEVRIVVADDHAMVREGIHALLDSCSGYLVVAEAENGQEAVKKAEEFQADLVLMDISMPVMDGVSASRVIRKSRPQTKILALSAHDDDVHIRKMFKAGASGYLLKRTAFSHLTRAIDSVVSGGMYLDPFIAARVTSGFISAERSTSRLMDLSPREQDVMLLIALGHSNKDIAERLGVSVKTVETYKSRSCKKLDLGSRSEIVNYALSQGWMSKFS